MYSKVKKNTALTYPGVRIVFFLTKNPFINMENNQKPGKRFLTPEGNMCVNFHNTFFIMTPLGKYLPWKATLHHGKLMPQQEWMRLRNLSGGEKSVKELTPFLNKKAEQIAKSLKENRFYKMTDEQISEAQENYRIWQCAQAENVSIEEYLHREKIRKERAEKRALNEKTTTKVLQMKVKNDNGCTNFFLGDTPGFEALRQKLS